MTNKFFSLTAVQLKGVLMTGQFAGNSKKQKNRKMAIIAMMFALIAFLFIFYCGFLTYAYIRAGLEQSVMPMMMAVASIFILITTLFKANGFMFASKDDDLLMSLPIKTSVIIQSRFVSLYIFECAVTALIIIPSLIVWQVLLGFDAAVLAKGIFSVFFIPMIPLAIASLIGIFITYISARFKYKNLVAIILGMAFLIAVMYLSMNASNIDMAAFTEINQVMISVVVSVYPPAKLYMLGMEGNLLAYVGFIALSIILIAAVAALITVNFKKITTMLNSHHAKSSYKMETLKTSGALGSLIGKEFKLYFSLTGYVLNTSFGPILMIVAAVAVFFIKDLDVLINIPGFTEQISVLIPIAATFFTALSSTTYPSVSLEGNRVWLTASLPVSYKTVYLAKIAMNLIISIPVCLISTVLFIIRFQPEPAYAVMTVLVPLAAGIFMAFFGLTVNLKFPNFEWTNATAVVKQSAGGIICSIGGLIIVLAPGALILMTDVPALAVYGILLILFIGGTIVSWKIASKTPLVSIISQ